MTLAAGTYVVTANVTLVNGAALLLQDNGRSAFCSISPGGGRGYEDGFAAELGEALTPGSVASLSATRPMVLNTSTLVSLQCEVRDGGTDRSYVFGYGARLFAIRVESLVRM